MSASLPVVAPRLTGIEEVGLPGNPAFYGPALGGRADVHDPALIAEAMANVEAGQEAHRRAARLASAEVGRRYSLEAMIRAHEEIYRRLAR